MIFLPVRYSLVLTNIWRQSDPILLWLAGALDPGESCFDSFAVSAPHGLILLWVRFLSYNFEYLGEFSNKFENILAHWLVAQVCSIYGKTRGKNLVGLSLFGFWRLLRK